MKRNKKVFSLVLLLMLLVVSVSGCKTKKHKKPSTVTTTKIRQDLYQMRIVMILLIMRCVTMKEMFMNLIFKNKTGGKK